MAVICLGLGLPLIIWGVAGWAGEGIANAANETGWSLTGLPLFILSEVLIFLCLFVAYWMLRLAAPVWPPRRHPAYWGWHTDYHDHYPAGLLAHLSHWRG